MKFTLIQLFVVIVLLISSKSFAQNTVTTDELKILVGEWKGNLTYIDYTTNKPFSMPANLSVKQNKNQLILFNTYPKEPKANGKDKIKLSKDGSKINGVEIKSKEILDNGDIQVTTEKVGKDNNLKATIRQTYILGKNRFIIRKEVKFEDSQEWLKRNEYNYTR